MGKFTVKFNAATADALSSLMTITAVALILPTVLYSTLTSSRGTGVFEKVLSFSRGSAGILLIFYLLYLYFQLGTHSHLFVDAKQDDEPTEERRRNTGGDANESTSALNLWAAVIVLILATASIIVCTHLLLDGVDDTAKAVHTTKRFIAAIMLPIASNAPEFSTVISTSRSGKTNFALGVIVGSILQIALFVIPLLVILGLVIQQPMTLYFEVFQTTLLFFSVLMVNRILRGGEYTYLHGFMLIEL
jgi:Ca2+:H+ antiporter